MAGPTKSDMAQGNEQLCGCGHSLGYHDGPDGECEAPGCTCSKFAIIEDDEDTWYPGHPDDQDVVGYGRFDRDPMGW